MLGRGPSGRGRVLILLFFALLGRGRKTRWTVATCRWAWMEKECEMGIRVSWCDFKGVGGLPLLYRSCQNGGRRGGRCVVLAAFFAFANMQDKRGARVT